jgi:4-amino-4-deoxy-L-arabinose transferase-like glycosyltransferase
VPVLVDGRGRVAYNWGMTNDRHKKNKKLEILAAIFILLISMGLRINAPRADLPSHITFSGSILTDEGNQCHNSRSKALYNEWYPDDWRITNYNPILPYFKLASFKAFGVGIWQMRLFNYLFAFLSLLFFFLTLNSLFKEKYAFALLGAFLLGINFLYIMYNKIGTFETAITFWVILTIYFLEKYRSKSKKSFLLLSGAAAFMGFIFKSIMAYLLPLPFVVVMVMHAIDTINFGWKKRIKIIIRDLLFVAAGLLLMFLPWYIFHYLPNKQWIIGAAGEYMGKLMFPANLDAVRQNFLSFPWKDQLYKMPIVWLSSVLYIPVFVRRLLKRRITVTELAVLLFFFAHTFMFFFMSYRPTRYFVPVMPIMVFMTVFLLERWHALSVDKVKHVAFSPFQSGFLFLLDTVWLTIAAYFCLLPLLGRVFSFIPRPPLSLLYLIVSGVLVAGVYYVKTFYIKIFRGKEKHPAVLLFKPVMVLMVLVSLSVNFTYYWQWHKSKKYTVYNMSMEMGKTLDPDSYIAGMTSTVAVLENKMRALWLYPGFVNWDEETFNKYPLTHGLLGTDISREVFHYFEQWPQRMKGALLQKVYHIKDYFLHLYSFLNPYISECRIDDEQNYLFTIYKPKESKISDVTLGTLYIMGDGAGFEIKKNQELQILNVGENKIFVETTELINEMPKGVESLLFFLDYDHAYGKVGTSLRYEGESFNKRVGFNKVQAGASGGYVRYYDPNQQGPGFLSYGPAVPFAPGVLIVDFKIAFSDIKTKIRPLAYLDIYSHQDKGPIAQRRIKLSDIKKAKGSNGVFATYRLIAGIAETKTLEFRLKVENQSNVSLDAIDVTYYQGQFTTLKQ